MKKENNLNDIQDEFKQAVMKHKRLVLAATYNILFVNDIVTGMVIDCFEVMKKEEQYKHRSKQLMNEVNKELKKYELMVNRVIASSAEYFANGNDAFCTEVYHYVDSLLFCVKSVFDKQQVPNSLLLAHIETTRFTCSIACEKVELWMNKIGRVDQAFARKVSLRYLRLTELKNKIDRLCDYLYNSHHISFQTVNSQCEVASKILIGKLSDEHAVIQAIEAAEREVR